MVRFQSRDAARRPRGYADQPVYPDKELGGSGGGGPGGGAGRDPGRVRQLVTRLVNLADSVQTLAIRTDDWRATAEASSLLEDVLEALPEDHPARALCLHNLARIYRSLDRRFPEPPSGFPR